MGTREIGFISEHTAEFVIVPDVLRHLRTAYPRIVPIYYWSTREGSRVSLETSANVRVVALFPRRPKVSTSDQDHVLVKFNASLFDYTTNAADAGILVLAGVPLASSLLELIDCSTAWFHIRPSGPARDAFCRLSLPDGEAIEDVSSNYLDRLRTSKEITRVVREETRRTSWSEAADNLRELRRKSFGERVFPWASGYRPVHLVILNGVHV